MELTTLTELNSKYHITKADTEYLDDQFRCYNCMGFALGSYNWDEIDTCGYRGYYDDDDEEYWDEPDDNTLLCAVDDVLNYSDYEVCYGKGVNFYPHIRFLDLYTFSSKEEDFVKMLDDDEYLVAMRLDEDDFHFARRMKDGSWWHKPGSWEIRKMNDNDLYNEANWCDRYYGNIAMFAVRPHRIENEVA